MANKNLLLLSVSTDNVSRSYTIVKVEGLVAAVPVIVC